GSAQNVSRALLALWENGYVERPEAQAASRLLYEGSRPAFTALRAKARRFCGDTGMTCAADFWMASTKSAMQAGGSSSIRSQLRNSWCALNWRCADATISVSLKEGRSSKTRRRAGATGW